MVATSGPRFHRSDIFGNMETSRNLTMSDDSDMIDRIGRLYTSKSTTRGALWMVSPLKFIAKQHLWQALLN